MRLFKRCGLALIICSLTALAATAGSVSRTQLYVYDKETDSDLSFSVELALTDAQRQKGLMFRENLPDDEGMLFIFRSEKMRSFWMHNTLIPLDIIFLRQDGTIINIVEAAPMTDDQRKSVEPAKAVLEIRGGLAKELGINAGDTVHHALLGNAKASHN